MITYVKFHAEKDIRLFIERVGNGNIYRSLRIWLVIPVIMTSWHRSFEKTVYVDFCYIL